MAARYMYSLTLFHFFSSSEVLLLHVIYSFHPVLQRGRFQIERRASVRAPNSQVCNFPKVSSFQGLPACQSHQRRKCRTQVREVQSYGDSYKAGIPERPG